MRTAGSSETLLSDYIISHPKQQEASSSAVSIQFVSKSQWYIWYSQYS